MRELVIGIAHRLVSSSGVYTPPDDGEPVGVDVHLQLGVETINRVMRQVDDYDFVYFLSEQVEPETGGTLSDVDGYDGKTWEIGKRDADDNHRTRWRIIEQ